MKASDITLLRNTLTNGSDGAQEHPAGGTKA